MITLLPLLGKRIEDLTLIDLERVKKALKIDVQLTEELRAAGIAMLKGDGINTAADMIQSPESVQKLLSFFQKPPAVVDDKPVIRCPHCNLFFI